MPIFNYLQMVGVTIVFVAIKQSLLYNCTRTHTSDMHESNNCIAITESIVHSIYYIFISLFRSEKRTKKWNVEINTWWWYCITIFILIFHFVGVIAINKAYHRSEFDATKSPFQWFDMTSFAVFTSEKRKKRDISSTMWKSAFVNHLHFAHTHTRTYMAHTRSLARSFSQYIERSWNIKHSV